MSAAPIPSDVRAAWVRLENARFERIAGGLINDTWLASCSNNEQYVLQCLHPVFSSKVNNDIVAVTQHLRSKGFLTLELVYCDDGNLCLEYEQRIWRLLTHINGQAYGAILSPAMASQAGYIVAQFHAAMSDFTQAYQAARSNVHDTARHLAHLQTVLEEHDRHRLYDAVAPLANRILTATNNYMQIDQLPLRNAHGDLKISNILFDPKGQAVSLIDLDTVNRMPWPLEMGDALRSWCNPRTEDQLSANLDLEILDAALRGYNKARPQWLSTDECGTLIAGLERICLELSARFLADALTENYFGWDRNTFATAGDHNLARGAAVVALFLDVLDKRNAATSVAQKNFTPKAD